MDKPNSTAETFPVTVTYLEQTARPTMAPVSPPAHRTALMRATMPPADYYRYLFNGVGGPHKWVSRRYLDDASLEALIHVDTTEIYVLYKDGWPAGFGEINTAHIDAVEIKFFGLLPAAQRMGLGRWFLQELIGVAWDKEPKRVFLETCTLDSPAALRVYQRAGFSVYNQGQGIVEWYG